MLSLAKRIQELTKENSQLKVEIWYLHQKQDIIQVFKKKFNFAIKGLEQLVAEFAEVEREIEEECDKVMRR